MRSFRRSVALLVVTALAVAVTACGGSDRSDGRLQVTVSFYPLAYLVEQIGGDAVDVTNLTAPGAEPHDLELSPAAVGTVADS